MSFACELKDFTFIWKIKNFTWCQHKCNEKLRSPNFSIDAARTTQFFLTLYPKGKGASDFVSLYLNRDAGDNGPIWLSVRYEFKVLDSCQIPHLLCAGEQVFRKGSGWGYRTFLERNSLFTSDRKNFLPEDVLTVCCRIVPVQEPFEYPDEKHLEQLSQDFTKLYFNGQNSDITLCCGDKQFPAHMIVLVSRCPVLVEALKLEFSQETAKEIALHDIDPAVLEGLLLYLYSGKLDGISLQQIGGLHSVAEKYKLVDLKAKLLLFASTVSVVTSFRVQRQSFTYTMESFKSVLKKEYFCTLPFANFSMLLNVKGFSTAEHENIEIHVHCISVKQESLLLTCNLSLKSTKGKVLNNAESKIWISGEGTLRFPCFIARNLFQEGSNSVDGALTLQFDVESSDGHVYHDISESSSLSPECTTRFHSITGLQQLSLAFRNLFFGGMMSDVKLYAEGILILAHKAVLCSRSPVFFRLLYHKSKVNNESIIMNISYVAAYCMLMYMYTGRLELPSYDDAISLFIAAKNYEIHSLKEKCMEIMKLNLRVDNAATILLLAHAHQEDELEVCVKDFITSVYTEFRKSEKWKSLMKTKPSVAKRLLNKLTSHVSDKRVNNVLT